MAFKCPSTKYHHITIPMTSKIEEGVLSFEAFKQVYVSQVEAVRMNLLKKH